MKNTDCLFCKIVNREVKAWIIWEDEKNIAFLTPYPNTPGFTVVAIKAHLESYIFDLQDVDYNSILSAAKKVGKLLDQKLHTKRTGLIMEGMGINHAHVKLIPMHGIPDGEWKEIPSKHLEFNELYQGCLSSNDGPRMEDGKLDEIWKVITGHGNLNINSHEL
jgi:diadenosine tetraphosphate (Ap4A) HIT family hydrolase